MPASNRTTSYIFRPMVSAIALVAIFLWFAPPVVASVALPSDVIESPKVIEADIATHFKNIFGRDPTAGEVKYWQIRLKDKPYELEFLAAMGYWAAKGTSPSIEDSKFTVTLSGTGHDIFAGQTRRHTVTVTHTNPVAQSGYLDIKVNVANVEPTPPLPNTQRTYVDGITRLRHHYYLAPNETLTVDLILVAPNKPNYTFEAILRGRGMEEQHVTKVYAVVPENLSNPTYQQRQISLMFARVFSRSPNAQELSEWRKPLQKTHRLETVQGAMEVAKLAGRTLPAGVAVSDSATIPIEDLNSVFASVYGRLPTASEWQYWADRLADKPTRGNFIGALSYHKANNITH